MPLPGNKPGNYVAPSGYPLPQAGAQAYQQNPVLNDPLAATVNDAAGNAAVLIYGPSDGTRYRLLRATNYVELCDAGSLTAALARANGMVAAGEVA